jgi:hypothetical protein
MKTTKNFEDYLKHATLVFRDLPWENVNSYSEWLAQTYFFVTKSTRLLALASAHTNKDQEKLHYRFIEHASEEKAHDRLLVNDLKQLGKTIDDFEEFSQTGAFYQAQYYWIQHVNSASFMGYIYILEGLAVMCGKEAYERVLGTHGKKAGSFLLVHSNEDIDHLQKAEEQIKKLDKTDFESFMENLRLSAGLYEQILIGCQKKASEKRTAA